MHNTDNKAEHSYPQSPSPVRGDIPALVLSKVPSSASLNEAVREDMDSEREEGGHLGKLDVVDDESVHDDCDKEGANGETRGREGAISEEESNAGETGGPLLNLSMSAGYGLRDEIAFREYGFADLEERHSEQDQSSESEADEMTAFPSVTRTQTPPSIQPDHSKEPKTPPPAPPSFENTPVKDSPLARTQNGQKYRFGSNRAERRYIRFAEEVSRVLVGPMPVSTFLDEFLPQAPADKMMPESKGAFNRVPKKPKKEAQIYTALITAINEAGRCPSVAFVDTSASSDKGRGVCKPDVSGYDPDDIQRLVPVQANQSTTDFKQPKSGKKGGRKQPLRRAKIRAASKKKQSKTPTRYNANLGLADMYMEVKMKGLDPFCDKHKHDSSKQKSFFSWKNTASFDSSTASQSRRTLGQMAVYASEACARQHRMFYFSVLILGTCARLFRWDRAGVVVTEIFDYREQPDILCEFLWRFGNANPIQRGFDPTVTVASPKERELFEAVISEEVSFQLNIASTDTKKLQKTLKHHYEKGKVTKVLVHDRRTSKWEEYLVSVPVSSPRSFVGRCTRAYWSVRVFRDDQGGMRGEVAFLKDVWRIDVPRMEDEGSAYQDMQGKVRKIPGLLAYGDVSEILSLNVSGQIEDGNEQEGPQHKYQSTRTQEFINADWACSCLCGTNDNRRIVKHTHFRLTLDEVGYPLKDFENSRELFGATGDAFEALDSAFESRRRLHRDVSLDNIILVRCRETRRREGRLVDWEFSTVADRSGKSRDYFRSGTWAFMSAQALNWETKHFKHTQADDLESLFYVAMYCSLRWLRHNKFKNLGKWMFDFFDDARVMDERDSGGEMKMLYLSFPKKFSVAFTFAAPIQTWFNKVYEDLASTVDRSSGQRGDATNLAENFKQRMLEVNEALERGDQGDENDRVEHDVSDYHVNVEEPEVPRATHTSMTTSDVDLSAVLRASGTGSAVSGHQGSKRSLAEVDCEELETTSEGSRKRSRMNFPADPVGSHPSSSS